eukprot:TRINITY_DN2583_c0_g1_i1.p1 TRINITY_DN2583_c0_g1~~TRINITY_DN2583_c0_g1_i1.p1  ORF type:complete len:460 (+),score=65.86 TRINITY_DN2583_c0_g1_i1:138-1382(+)
MADVSPIASVMVSKSTEVTAQAPTAARSWADIVTGRCAPMTRPDSPSPMLSQQTFVTPRPKDAFEGIEEASEPHFSDPTQTSTNGSESCTGDKTLSPRKDNDQVDLKRDPAGRGMFPVATQALSSQWFAPAQTYITIPRWAVCPRSFSQPSRQRCGSSRGEVLAIFPHYGWIEAWDEIDEQIGRRIYFARDDVSRSIGRKLRVGDFVNFQVYRDIRGLGASHIVLDECQGEAEVEEEEEEYDAEEQDVIQDAEPPGTASQSAPSQNDTVCSDCFVASIPEAIASPHAEVNKLSPVCPPGLTVTAVESNLAQFGQVHSDEMSEEERSWRLRNLAAAAKVRGEVGGDIRWDLILGIVSEMKPAAAIAVPLERPNQKVASNTSTCTGVSSDSDDSDDEESIIQAARLAMGVTRPPGL